MDVVKLKYSQDWTDLLEDIKDGMEGNAIYIPNPLERVDQVFNLLQGRFTLLGSTSGAGKSAFIDDVFLLKPWWQYIRHKNDVHYEVLYYAMERTKKAKYSKWLAWMLYMEKGWLMSGEDLRAVSGRNFKNSEPIYEAIKGMSDPFNEFLDRVHVYDGRISGAMIKKHINEKAAQLGTLFQADSVGVTKDRGEEYIATFSATQVRELRDGTIEEYVEITHNGKTFTLTHDQRRYIFHKKETYVFVVIDGVGIINTDSFGGNVKKAVDSVTNLLCDARDIYGFSPIMVSQFNRGISDSQRAKLHGSSLSPQESDFKDSGNTYQAADLAIGLFDPFKFKAYSKEGLYGGYDVLNGMMSPNGHNRFRTMHILKNSYGIDGGIFGLKFLGECGYFEVLPKPETYELEEVYSKIAAGR